MPSQPNVGSEIVLPWMKRRHRTTEVQIRWVNVDAEELWGSKGAGLLGLIRHAPGMLQWGANVPKYLSCRVEVP